MEVKQSDIHYDAPTQKHHIRVVVTLADGNRQMLVAKAELYGSIMDGLDELVTAKIAEFAEKYGEEVIKFAHNR